MKFISSHKWFIPIVASLIAAAGTFMYISSTSTTSEFTTLGSLFGPGVSCGAAYNNPDVGSHSHGGKTYDDRCEEAGGRYHNYHVRTFTQNGVCKHEWHWEGGGTDMNTERCDAHA